MQYFLKETVELPKVVVGDMLGFYGNELYSEAFIRPLKLIGQYYNNVADRRHIKSRWLDAYFDSLERILLGDYLDTVSYPRVKKALDLRLNVDTLTRVENVETMINALSIMHIEMITATLGYLATMGLAEKTVGLEGSVITTNYLITDYNISTGIIKLQRLD